MIDATRKARIEDTFRAFEDQRTDECKRDVRDILEHDDGQVRTAALQTLTEYAGEPQYVESFLPLIVARTTDPEPKVRNAAREMMSRLAEAYVDENRPLPGLEELVTSDTDEVRRDALHGAKMAGERHPSVLTDHLPILTDRLSDSDLECRRMAALVVGHIAEARPDEVAKVTPELVDHLETDDVLVRNAVMQALTNLSTHRPQAVVDAVPAIRSELDADILDTESMIETLANVAEAAPESVANLVPVLVDTATEPTDTIQQNGKATSMELVRENDHRLTHESTRADSLRALGSIAEHDPDAIVPASEDVLPLLASDVPSIREETTTLLRSLGIERPQTMETSVPVLLERIEEAQTEAERMRLLQTLVAFGDASPSEFTQGLERRTDHLVDLLSHDDPEVRGAAAGFLSYIAERDPTAVSAVNETLIALLDDSNPVVRGNAVLVLGICGSDDAKNAIASLEPDDEFVEDAVEQALKRLE